MGRLDRFLRLERPRPDRKDGGSAASLDRFRDPPPAPPDDEEAGGVRVPRSCAKCGAENNLAAPRCFNCDADLDTSEMRAHQRGERRRAREENEKRRREAEELAERELEKLRRESAARRETVLPPVPGTIHESPFASASASPLVWLLRGLSVIEDPWYRFGARVLVIGAFLGLVFYALSSPARYPLFILAAVLLGGAFGGRRWDRWGRWR
jgi:hypothetical protein